MANRRERRALAKAVSRGAVDLKANPADNVLAEELPRASLAYCWNEKIGVSGFWHQSVLRAMAGTARRLRWREIPVESGPFLSRARNAAMNRFLETDDAYLLFTDTDVVFEPEDVIRLLEADAPIAGALYYAVVQGVDPWPTALVAQDDSGENYVPWDAPELPSPPDLPEGIDEMPEGDERTARISEFQAALATHELSTAELLKPVQVASVGFGLTLIRRDVVEGIKATYPHPAEFEGDKGEDLVFCLRAAEMGFETVLVPQARIGHSKVVVI